MRRKDREVPDLQEIFDILLRCDTVRIGMSGPYIVPVSFGTEMVDGTIVIYFHCAREGQKTNVLKSDPRVCVEADRFIRTELTDHGITTRYESVIGSGICQFPDDEHEIIHGLKTITDHYGYYDYDLADCRALEHVLVGKIVLDEITGKRNPVNNEKKKATIEHAALYVNDLEAARDFFVTYLGGRSNDGYHNSRTNFRSYFIRFESGARLELMTKSGMEDQEKPLNRTGYAHIAFSVGSREKVDELTERLRSAGFEVVSGPRTTGDGYYESCVVAIEGNKIEITE